MLTPLDDAKTWFLHAVVYQGELSVIVVEGFVGDAPEDIKVGEHTASSTYPIDVRADSRLFSIRFPRFVAWQVVDEAFTAFDEYEKRDDTGTLQVLERSKYFDYVKASHGWFEDVIGPARHYRIWTENEVVDVVSISPPTVEPWTASNETCMKPTPLSQQPADSGQEPGDRSPS